MLGMFAQFATLLANGINGAVHLAYVILRKVA